MLQPIHVLVAQLMKWMICQELNTTEMFCKQSKHNPLHDVVADYRQCDMSHGERDWEWLSHVRKLIDHTSLSLNKEINGCVLCNTCLLFWDCFRQVCNSSTKNRWKHESTVSVNGIEVCSQVTQCIQYYISPSIKKNFWFFCLFSSSLGQEGKRSFRRKKEIL